MQGKKHITAILVLTSLVIAGVAAVNAPGNKYKNLQILPKDISEHKLDSIMQSYNKALGMGCGFCHSPLAGFTDSLDYAADKNEMKENARKMMRMTIEINKSNFYFDKNQRPEYLNVVSCNTCHRGEPYPEQ
jgi:Photosynthetic reaction centre cytochrome C subunit